MAFSPKLLQQGASGAGAANYIEDVFSCFLYTGNSSTQTITNGINLSANGGLVWIKNRTGAISHALIDTARGGSQVLSSDTTSAQANYSPQGISAFNSSGFTVNGAATTINSSSYTYASWTFRKQPKFFDVVTYTGNGSSLRSLPHSLGSEPGFIVVKKTSDAGDWGVYHRSLPAAGRIVYLNLTFTDSDGYVGFTPPTSSIFYVGGGGSGISGGTVNSNDNGQTYVAYLFAHNAGGFGLTGLDNVISCGSYTGTGAAGNAINLGYEPQFLIIKRISAAADWFMLDNMRGIPTGGNDAFLWPNQAFAENGDAGFPFNAVDLTATGFTVNTTFSIVNASSNNYIYIAIRRGPMKVPTTGTSVFTPATSSATGSVLTTNFPVDMGLIAGRVAAYERGINDRLRGFANADSGSWPWLTTHTAAAEASQTPSLYNANNTSIQTGAYFGSTSAVSYLFRRAPGFFDEVCYTGTAANRTITHNLTVAPQLVIIKSRSNGNGWVVGSSLSPNVEDYMWLHLTNGWISGSFWNNTRPTSTTISLSDGAAVNADGLNFVAYLFATCPGVSKVGSYTGNGSTQTIDCGFAAGARFVLIKRTDSTGDWYTFDTARGIIAGNDPFLKLNTTDAEVTSYDAVDPANSGFIVNNDATNFPINVASATYIFLAIA